MALQHMIKLLMAPLKDVPNSAVADDISWKCNLSQLHKNIYW